MTSTNPATPPLAGDHAAKVRIGFGLGTATDVAGEMLDSVVDELERLGFDSLWFSERIGADAPDPLVAMAYTLGRTTHLKTGMSVMVVPGRNPITLAKAVASLAVMAPKRVLPAFGLGTIDHNEQAAFGVSRSERGSIFDEAMSVMRSCWDDGVVTFEGKHFRYDGVRVGPTPPRLDVWLGGNAPPSLRRTGQFADGWLPSFVTPDEVAAGRAEIERIAAEHRRTIEPDHFGVLIPYSFSPLPDSLVERFARRRPDVDIRSLAPGSWDALATAIAAYIDAGASKFVIVPFSEPGSSAEWVEHLQAAAEALLPLEITTA